MCFAAAYGLTMLLSGGGCAAGNSETGEDDSGCTIGSETCACTKGGACDPGLECLSSICVDPNSTPGSGGAGGAGGGITVSSSGNGGACDTGCQAVDVVFALDSSASMAANRGALAASSAFQSIVQTLAGINCGNIDYRIGVTSSNDPQWFVPGGFAGSWFDSTMLTDAEIVTAFGAAAASVTSAGEPPLGCEHVLTNSTTLLSNDNTGFIRDGALLVLVFVTDVDDYGAYDQLGGNTCNVGCSETVPQVQSLFDTLVTLKGGDPAAVASVIIAGDPNMNAGVNLCNQPGSCGCTQFDCTAFHATRLWQYAALHSGTNGVTTNICAGAQSVPTAVDTAFANNISLACETLEPPK